VEHAEPDLVDFSDSDVRVEERWHDVRDLDVYDINGEQIGTVESLFVERESGVPRFVVVSAGGLLGLGKEYRLIPVEDVSRDVGAERVTVTQNRDKVMGSPDFEPDEVPKADVQRAVRAYYGLP
jgi:sporulation protein YlmC with PRC-barrel domain